jgi:hypothetical protein
VLEVTFAATQTKIEGTSTDFGEVTSLVWKTAGAAMLFPKLEFQSRLDGGSQQENRR